MALWRTSASKAGVHHIIQKQGRAEILEDYNSRKGGRTADTHAPSVMGPMVSSLPSKRRAAELMLLSVVDAWPPHHAVRGSGEPI
jgi:hypothetical protein